MTPRQCVSHGNQYPYDAPDEWRELDDPPPLLPRDKYHSAARAVVANLQDRRGIKHGFANVDEDIRAEIIDTLSLIIREALEDTTP